MTGGSGSARRAGGVYTRAASADARAGTRRRAQSGPCTLATAKQVWDTRTFPEAGARSSNRTEMVRAHNCVVMGDLVPG
jgi:hypothetical protein